MKILRTTALTTLLTPILALLAPPSAGAAPNTVVQIVGVLRTASGGPASDGDYGMEFGIHDAATGGKLLWSQTFSAIAVRSGRFVVTLGSGKAKDALPLAILATDASRWLSVKVGSDPELPRKALRPAPYANRAGTAALADKALLADKAKAADLAKAAETADNAKEAAHAKSADGAQEAAHAKTADKAVNATKAATAQTALRANALNCTGCIRAAMLASDLPEKAGLVRTKTLHKVAISGQYSDLVGKPKLGPYGRTDAANKWAFTQTFGAGVILSAPKAPSPCAPKVTGLLYYDTTNQELLICNGKSWALVAFVGTVGTQSNPAKSCKEIKIKLPAAPDGKYWLKPGTEVFQVWCDMSTDGGGWTLIESYDISQRGAYNHKPFINKDMPRNQDAQNWDDYRLSNARIKALFATATRFHARCDRDAKRSPKDWLYGDIALLVKNFGGYLLNTTGSNPYHVTAMVRGYSSTKYNFRWWNIDGGNNWHSGFDVSSTLPNPTSSEDSFTWHDGGLNVKHRCHTAAGEIVWMVR